jgi:hypothetical protein
MFALHTSLSHFLSNAGAAQKGSAGCNMYVIDLTELLLVVDVHGHLPFEPPR